MGRVGLTLGCEARCPAHDSIAAMLGSLELADIAYGSCPDFTARRGR